jgi:transposase
MTIRLREMTKEEVEKIQRLANSRTAEARLVERANIIRVAHEGKRGKAVAKELGLNPATVRKWLKRFNGTGLERLQDAERPGKPPQYTPEQVGEVVATALTNPSTLGLPFASWTLDRLEVYLNEAKGISIKRTRIDDILLAEGLRWRKQETWFGERVDPEFAEKRGLSPSSTPSQSLEV